MKFIHLDRQYLSQIQELNEATVRVLSSGHYILGPELAAFEEEFAEYCKVKHCIGVASGTDALILSLKAAGIGEGDEVIVPANTYIATWFAVSHVGATPIPVEPAYDYCIDVEKIEEKLTCHTKAIIPVHLFGLPADMIEITQLATKHDLVVISDCAQAHGARFDGVNVGAWGDLSAFSFYPTKPLGGFGDGGAVTTHNDEYADRLRFLRWEGQVFKDIHNEIGHNSLLDELQAALLRVRLKNLDVMNSIRAAIARRYYRGLEDLPLHFLVTRGWSDIVFHQFVIRCSGRGILRDYLAKQCIPTLIHYPIPPHLQNAYEHLGYEKGDFPITEEFADTMLSLPICPTMTEDEVEQVIEAVRSFF